MIIPVRDRSEQLASCLARIAAQDYPPDCFEIVVCNDGSVEDLETALQPWLGRLPRLRIVRQPPLGPAAARNLGIRSTTAPVLVFLDSDVEPEKNVIRLLASALDAQPGWAGAEAALVSTGGGSGPLWDGPSSGGGRYHTAAIAYRRSALLIAGGFDESFPLPACEDVEIAARVLRLGGIGFVPEARVSHPRRRAGADVHWGWRRRWKYELILALRYGFLSFPGRNAGPAPRLRLALAAVATFPGGRFLAGLKHLRRSMPEGIQACFLALLDVAAGISALPDILMGEPPPRRSFILPSPALRPALQQSIRDGRWAAC